jgi:acyl-CoA synthetase (AMP-forming)/AMP-acid ligase II
MPDAGFLRTSCHDPAAKTVFDGNAEEWFTRAQLTAHVADVADRLQFPRKALGFLFAWNDFPSLVAYLAAIQAGHAVAMLNPELDAALKARLISRFQPDFIVAPESHPPPSICDNALYRAVASRYPGQLLLRSTAPNQHPIHPDLTLLISTSGSTGSPKLVRLSWTNLESNACQINNALHNTEQDRTVVTAPIFNGYGQSVIHTMLTAGGSFALTRARIISREFWDVARQAECTAIGGVPYFYQTLDRLDLNSLDVPRLTKFVQTGGRLPVHLARKYHSIAQGRGGGLHLMYGQAEATARITGLPPELLPEAPDSIGVVLPGGRLWVERGGCECGPMEEGELIYHGPNVMMGYATCPGDLARADDLGGTVATGDLGYRDSRGLFFITGRASRFVKLHGWRVSLDEVEELLSHAGTVAAIGEPDRLVIYTEASADTLAGAVTQLAARLNLHPSGFEIRVIENIPRLANGKVNYSGLARSAGPASDERRSTVPAHQGGDSPVER